jgi:hypothetical protein
MQDQIPLSGWEVRGDLACLLCSRTVATAQGPRARKFVPTSVRVIRPEHASAVQEMRCPFCAGRLWLQDTEEIFVDRRPLSAEELRPRRGRPPKVRPAVEQPAARAS